MYRYLLCYTTALMLITPKIIVAAEFIPLGFPPGEFASFAEGISPDGSFVLGWGDRSMPQAFRWSEGSGITMLGDLPGGYSYSEAFDASFEGSVVVGTSSSSIVGPSGGEALQAFRWTVTGGIEGLGILSGARSSSARAVSGDGSIVVGNSAFDDDHTEGWWWTVDSGLQRLGSLPGGNNISVAKDVSTDGSVAVGVATRDGVNVEAFRWTTASGIEGLGTLPGDQVSEAHAVSANGEIIVGLSGSSADDLYETFRWTEAGGLEPLGTPHGYRAARPNGVSADGSVIVGFSEGQTPADEHAFIWTESDGMRFLSDVLEDSGIDLTGWQLRWTSGISDDGNSIVGWGVNPIGVEEGWLVRLDSTAIPEPSTFCLLLVACAGLAVPRSTHRRTSAQTVRTLALTSIAFALPLSPTTPAGAAEFIPLGFPPGDNASSAEGISPDGRFVVGSGTLDGRFSQAFRWSQDAGFEMFGDLPGGSVTSSAWDASTDGSVIVGRSDSSLTDPFSEAFRWTESGDMQGLGVREGAMDSFAYGVSGDGSVVIMRSVVVNDPNMIEDDFGEALRWTADGGIEGLGLLPGGGFSVAEDISTDGATIVGRANSSSRDSEAFRWTESGGMVALGTLPGDDVSEAYGVSAGGSVVAGVSGSIEDGPYELFRWTETGGMQSLGNLPGYDDIGVDGVSADGSVIVGHVDKIGVPEGYVPFIWTEATGMHSIADVLTSRGVDLGDWDLRFARSISDDGNSIVGWGVNPDGIREGWLVRLNTVPEPGTFWLILIASGGFTVSRTVRRPNRSPMVAKRTLASISFAAPLALANVAGAAEFIGLGDAFGFEVRGMTANGEVVLIKSLNVRWSEATGVVGNSEESNFFAYGISGDGSVPVGSGLNSGVGARAARLTESAGVSFLGDPPSGLSGAAATEANLDGTVIAGNGFSENTEMNEAFRWTSESGVVGLGFLPRKTNWS